MAAVVRVKRALNEEPSGALILSCKRRKTEAENGDAVDTVFKFAGTVKDQEENIALLHPDKLTKADVKTASTPVPNLLGKVRAQAKASSQGNRYKLVNYFRTLGSKDESDPEKDGNQNSITVLDVESQLDSKNVEKDSKASENQFDGNSKDPQYVYDLYYIEADAKDIDVDDLMLDGLVSFAPVENELVFDTYRNNRAEGGNSDSDSPLMDDDDDSNDENNWRNDYPDDEEGGDSDGDGGLASRFGKVTFGDHELSSDSDDERLIYNEELSPSDVRMYGLAYAKFKKNALKELDSSTEINSNSDEDEYSKSDADSDEND
ncbi:probable RNA polymerase II nuclear localization protein SLC7A6OS [Thrips palmi]|uniref:Probable RNA polymerase II nuclear localization protein SLC7A6OS n=1 Tax=Thrips palmi TaxID=161013 RepID=A0A6P8ZGR4_THRPL|nr:probable RNA polymerase II nuclear localization protein SLC7A6OS [Thrips palmi]